MEIHSETIATVLREDLVNNRVVVLVRYMGDLFYTVWQNDVVKVYDLTADDPFRVLLEMPQTGESIMASVIDAAIETYRRYS